MLAVVEVHSAADKNSDLIKAGRDAGNEYEAGTSNVFSGHHVVLKSRAGSQNYQRLQEKLTRTPFSLHSSISNTLSFAQS